MKLELDDRRLVIGLTVPNTEVEIEASGAGLVLTFQRDVTAELRTFLGKDDTVNVDSGAGAIQSYLRRTYGIDIDLESLEDTLRGSR